MHLGGYSEGRFHVARVVCHVSVLKQKTACFTTLQYGMLMLGLHQAEDAAEAAALAAEADMPLEELLAAMGYAPQGHPAAASSPDDAGAPAQQAADNSGALSSAPGSTKAPGPARSKGAAAADTHQQAALQQVASQPPALPVKVEPDDQRPQGSDSSGAIGDSPRGWAQLLAEADDAAQTPATALNGKAQAVVKSPTSPATPASEKRVTRQAAAAAGATAPQSGAAVVGDSKREAASAGAVKSEDEAAPATVAAEAVEAAAEEEDQQHGSLEDAARAAIAAQPTGFTLSTTNVQTKVLNVLVYRPKYLKALRAAAHRMVALSSRAHSKERNRLPS